MEHDTVTNSFYFESIAENASKPAKPYDRLNQTEWITAQVVNFVALFAIGWIALSLLLYGRRTGKWEKANRSNPSNINAGSVYTSALVAAIVGLIPICTSQAVFNYGYHDVTSWPCEISLDITVFGFVSTSISIYTFLWLRQRSLYQHAALSQSTKQVFVKKLSWPSIVIIVAGCLFAGIAYIVPNNYTRSSRGCVAKAKGEFVVWPAYVSNAVVFIGQALMLLLFLFPLRAPACQQSNAKRIRRMLKRSAILAVICIASDLVALVTLTLIVPESSTRHVTVTVYDISIFVNLVSILMSFESWREILKGPFSSTRTRSTSFYATDTSNNP